MPHPKTSTDPTFTANQTPHLITRPVVKKTPPEPPPTPNFKPLDIDNHNPTYLVEDRFRDDPLALFSLFFTDEILEALSTNSNAHATRKRLQETSENPTPWHETTPDEIRAFLACHIYFGLHKEASISSYWTLKYSKPTHQIIHNHISRTRYKQIERYFHISPPCDQYQEVFEKLEPLNSHILDVCKALYTPGTHVAVDEAMTKWTGRSKHTIELPDKPIPKGYKIWVLAYKGYAYHWLFHTKYKRQGPLLLDLKYTKPPYNLSKTEAIIITLLRTLALNGQYRQPLHVRASRCYPPRTRLRSSWNCPRRQYKRVRSCSRRS